MLYGELPTSIRGRCGRLKAGAGSLFLTHPVDVVGTGKGAGADFLGIALDRPFDRGPELAEPLDEFRSEEHTSELQSHRDLHSFPTRRLPILDVVGTGKGAGADFLGIALDRPFDRGPELAEPLDEF